MFLVKGIVRDCICRSSHQPDECSTKPCFRWVWRKVVAKTHPAVPKMPRASSAFSQKRAPRAPGDKHIAPPRRVWALGNGLLKLEEASLSAPEMNAGLSESISDGLDRLPPEPGRARHECRLTRIHVRWYRPTATGTRTHPTKSVSRPTRTTEVCHNLATTRKLVHTLHSSGRKS